MLENLFVASTYKAILDRVAKTALAHADIHFSTKVWSIESDRPSMSDDTESDVSNPRILLRTSNHLHPTLEFDEVVLTTPLGWLKHHHPTAFKPPLPSRLCRAIKNISYGHLEKVYITFPTAFWDTRSPPSTAPSSDGVPGPQPSTIPVRAPTAPNGSSSDNTKSPEDHASSHPPFTHFLSPTYAHHTNPQQWNQELITLSSLPHHCAHPTLLFYIYGPCSAHIASLSSTEQIRNFFQPYYSRLPNYRDDSDACRPVDILATNWSNDELAGWGSYSNFLIPLSSSLEAKATPDGDDPANADEEIELDEDILALRAGMPERGVWLAGEHTAPFVALGTVTGAWWSGEGVGRRIVGMYGGGNGGLKVDGGD